MQNPTHTYDGWVGRNAYDNTGEKIGEITDIFYDDRTGRPEWVTVKTGLFKGSTFVPIHGSQIHDGGDEDDEDSLRLAFPKDMIKDAPRVDTDSDHLDPAEEQELWAYYGYDYDADPKLKTYGYGTNYTKNRADKEFQVRPYDRDQRTWSETERSWAAPAGQDRQDQRMEEHTEEVPVKTTAQVEVPVDTTVRLRRYQTKQQKTRTVEIPYEETTEHAEVADVEARAGQPTTTRGAAEVGRSKPVQR
jgi:hypothetical protein